MRLALFTRMLASCLVDADRLNAAIFDAGGMLQALPYEGMDALYERLDAHMEKLRNATPDPNPRRRELNRVRGEIQAECLARAMDLPGLFTLTVPTGGGKTLASLVFALAHIRAHAQKYGLRRVFYMLPYTSIIEQNADVYRKLLGAANVLEHHSNARPVMEESKDA
ncbi:MAG TPA: CRISPR-associated helicase/endonuclease Cas3, partial [Clostridia bacterium]|nr:CRISPR-associated helicase/endonuclease Cas3 [Clostridia bacterium]